MEVDRSGCSFSCLVPAALRAQESEEFDQYKLRFGGFWFYSQPTGTIQGHADQFPSIFNKDLGFSVIPLELGFLDWKFTHKNHLYVTCRRCSLRSNLC